MKQPQDEEKWLAYLGLRKNPFPVAPDADNFYVCNSVDQALTELVHGITARKGFIIFTGEVGLGKTTICRKIMAILEEKGVQTSLVFHTFYQESELLREIIRDFGLQCDSLLLSDQMRVLNDFLLDQHRQGRTCAMLIDDAQNLSRKSLELIRMISNLETNQEKLVQILLIGQPELEQTLNSHDLRQLKSRIMIHAKAEVLSPESLQGYIMFKLYMAGNTGQIKVPGHVINKVCRITRGNLRQVNILMERCLQAAFVRNTKHLSRSILKDAHKDLMPTRPLWRLGRRLVWGLCVPLALILFLAGWFLSPTRWSLLSGSYAPKHDVTVGFLPGDQELDGKMNEQEIVLHGSAKGLPDSCEAYSQEDPWELGHADAIAAFLESYGLSSFSGAFTHALHMDYLDKIVAAIFEQTGQQMVALRYLPEDIRQHYGVLGLSRSSFGSKTYLLFWKPELTVKEFYPGYRGDEIRRLEALLAQWNLYNYSLDSVVGPRLWRAVKRFQQANQLQVSGFPDKETIFLLCHQDRSAGS